jgi:L-lactate utilization protein LutB
MSEKGQELYDKVKEKITRTQQKGTLENQFGEFWKLACMAKYRSFELQHLYDDSAREFVEKYKNALIQMRQYCVDNLDDLVKKCMNVMDKTNHMKVYYAKTNGEAQKIFMEELGENKVIYKSKSNEAKDTGIMDILINYLIINYLHFN